MARFCPEGQVVGIEADRHIFEILRDNVAINGFSQHARAIHAAAGATVEPMTLYRRVGRPGNTSMVFMDQDFTTSLGEPPVEPFQVSSIRIDDVARDIGGRVNFIKIDVEGAEPLVIEGALQTIAANPDLRIIMEWSPGQIQCAGFDVASFADRLASIGLRAYLIEDERTVHVSPESLKTIGYEAGILLQRT